MNITFRVIRIFIEIYNCFTARFTVEFTITTDTPIYNQYQAVFFTRRAVILAKNRPGDEAKSTYYSQYLHSSVPTLIRMLGLKLLPEVI